MKKDTDFISCLFEEKPVLQSYLDVEAALAKAQAKLGLSLIHI